MDYKKIGKNMSEILNRMNYLEQRLTQFKSIVSTGSKNKNQATCQQQKESSKHRDRLITSTRKQPKDKKIENKDLKRALSARATSSKFKKDKSYKNSSAEKVYSVLKGTDKITLDFDLEKGNKNKNKRSLNVATTEACMSNNAASSQNNEKSNSMVSTKSERKILADNWKPIDKLEWGEGLFLIGDVFWNSFLKYARIQRKITKLEEKHNGRGKCGKFRLFVRKNDEVIENLYDSVRGKLLFALPPKVKKVCISIGAQDISNIVSQVKNKKVVEGECQNKDKNVSFMSNAVMLKLEELAKSIKSMVMKLQDMNKAVILLVPHGNENFKLFDVWREMMANLASTFPSPLFQILYLSDVMQLTLHDFASPQEMFESWFDAEEQNPFSLSEFGSAHLLKAVEEAILSNTSIVKDLANNA